MAERKRKYQLPPDPKPQDLIAVIDSAEQTPLDLSPLRTVTASLETGDYSLLGLEDIVCIERKSLTDFLACCGRERERFEKCVKRMEGYPVRAIVIEASWADLEAGHWRGDITPTVAIASCLSWMTQGVTVVMAGDHVRAGRFVSRMLYFAGRRRYREARDLTSILIDPEAAKTRLSNNAPPPGTIDSFCLPPDVDGTTGEL